jgi:hypothetical protein
MLATTTNHSAATIADIAGATVNGVLSIPAPPTMQPVTATAVTAMDVAVRHANDTMIAALADLDSLRRDMLDDEIAALEADAFAAYVRTMDLLELDPESAFTADRWAQFEATAAQRTRRNALAARRRADSLWGAQTAIAANVTGITLADVLSDDDAWEVREDLACAGLL